MKIAIACDHRGIEFKQAISTFLKENNCIVEDCGTLSTEVVDYPDLAAKVAQEVSQGRVDRGILICGSGVGMAISANKVKGIRAALANDLYCARYSRLHNDANILCMGQMVVGLGLAKDIVDVWLKTPYEGGRHDARIAKMMQLEDRGE